MSVLEKRLEETTTQNSTTTRQLLRLEEEHQRLMGVTGELINALESAIQGRVVDMENILGYCQREVPNLLAQLSNQNTLKHAGSPDSPDEVKMMDSTTGSEAPIASTLVAYELNYHLVKNELLRSDLETKCRLIQALRWQLTKCGSLERRHSTLMAFISHDLLGCFKRQSEYATRLLHLLRSPSTRLQQGLYRLINAFASFCKGRSYLARNPQLVSVMVDSLADGQMDPVAKDMVIASLQKLSLRRTLAVIMVDGGTIGWLLKTLPLGCDAEGSLNPYAFEFATALFMNLCLCPRGRKACSSEAQLTLDVIEQLYDRNVPEVLPYLNGSLYSLISDRELLSEARARKFMDKLQQLRNGPSEELSKQVNCILEKLETDSTVQEDKEDEKTFPEEEETSTLNDETEMEIDQGEPCTLEDAVAGETLLWKLYTQPSKPLEPYPRRSISTSGSRIRRQTQAVNPMPNNQETRKSRSSGRKSPFASELPAISQAIRKANLVNGTSMNVVPSTDSANVLQVTPVIRTSPPEPVNLPEILNTPSVLDSIHPDTVFAARPKVNGTSMNVVSSTDSANVLQVTPVIRTSSPEPVNLPAILNTPSVLDSIHPDTVFAARPKVPRTPEGGRR
ncbi:lisH domain-containing protein ARMC9 [Galendromus occidentalis]|uniref:LisH domain-containing protein ARMC9 n=1 Tax=Galendromus occidentalis TaxID=34638 RepID=A0AAJ6QNF5_9ACAR|nr:lisH domain-containing protein ARMC9 [Galendromus occidentalis]